MSATTVPARAALPLGDRSRAELVVDIVIAAAVVLVVVVGLSTHRFVTIDNARAILTSASLVGIAALGLTLIMIGGSAVSLAISQTVAAAGWCSWPRSPSACSARWSPPSLSAP